MIFHDQNKGVFSMNIFWLSSRVLPEGELEELLNPGCKVEEAQKNCQKVALQTPYVLSSLDDRSHNIWNICQEYTPPFMSNKGNGCTKARSSHCRGEKKKKKGFRAEELAENIKLRGRMGKMTKEVSLAIKKKKKTKQQTTANRVIK